MVTLLAVLGLAFAWHFGLAMLTRHLHPGRDRPSLKKLLLLAEIEILRTLRAEIKRRSCAGPESRWKRKLTVVEGRLRELDEGCRD